MTTKRELIDDCRFCGLDGFDIGNFTNVINRIPCHKNHTKESRTPTLGEVDYYYSLVKEIRKANNIYPHPETPQELISNIAFASYKNSEGQEQKFVSISEPEHLEGINRFEDYQLVLGRDISNFENITTDGYLSSALLACDTLKVDQKFTHKHNIYQRWHDTEFKILEYLTIQLLGPDNQEIKEWIKQRKFYQIHTITSKFEGVLKIFSERRVCESCANAIKLFKKIFPNITVDVIEGGGDHIDYGPNGIEFPKTQAGICRLRREIALTKCNVMQ
jgi:The  BURPS668_1122 family of deaminases